MHAHNYFTINKNGESSVYFNKILSPKAALKRNVPFSNFIALGSGAGLSGDRLNNMVYCNAVTLGNNNRNPAKGVLHATFSISVASATAITFSEIVLCENSDGSGAVSYTTCEPTVITATPIEVSVTIFAVATGDVVVLEEENNIFSSWMLGIGSAINTASLIATTYNDFPSGRNFRVTSMPTSGTAAATISFNDEYLEYKTKIAMQRDDICLYNNNQAYLRAKISHKRDVIIRSVKCNTAYGLAIEGLDINEYMNVTVNGETITDFEVHPHIAGVSSVVTYQEFNFGDMAQLKDCGSGRYVAVVTNAEVYLLDYNVAGFTIRLKVAYDGEQVIVCKNGSLILWGDTMKIYRVYDGEPTTYSEVALCRGSMNAIVSEGSQLHAARIFNKKIERYKVFGGNATLIAAFDAGENQILVRNDKHIFWHGPGCPCGSASIILDYSGNAAKIAQFYVNNPTIEIVKYNDTNIVYKSGTGFRVCAIRYGTSVAIVDPILGNSLAVAHHNNGLSYTFNPVSRTNGNSLVYNTDRPNSVRVKDVADTNHYFILLLENGTVQHCKVSRRIKCITSPKIVAGVQVGYMAVGEAYPASTNNWLTLRLYYPGCEPT